LRSSGRNIRYRPIADIRDSLDHRSMRVLVRPSLVALALLALGPSAVAQPRRSVYAGKAAEIVTDFRCNLATTYRLERGKRVNVRLSPNRNAPVVARLDEGRIVYVCDSSGAWLNVYFGGVEGPCFRTYDDGLRLRDARRCRSGWAHRDWVNILSG
jgi:hypothetical protein